MSNPDPVKLSADGLPGHLDALTQILHACVQDGAAVSFVHPFSLEDSRDFWRQHVFPAVRDGGCLLWIAFLDGRPAGTVQLQVTLPPNQPHRCEVAKLLVHPEYRQRGLGKSLMVALEKEARRLGKRLITLDTRTGDKAEPLYRALGYQTTGVVPNFALDPDGRAYHATTYMHKLL